MRSLFVMDPVESLNLAGDSTYMLMKASTARGWDTSWCMPNDLYMSGGYTSVRAQSIRTTAGAFARGEWLEEPLANFRLVWMRKDPPFDMHYIFTTYLLEQVGSSTLVLNRPAGLRSRNEKLFAAGFADLTPPTLVSRDVAQIAAFVRAQPDRAVLKPWDGNGGRGVLVTRGGDPNLRSMIELLTGDGREFIIAQRHAPEILEGDKRIILIDGVPAGAILRVPSASDHRGNMHAGATVSATTLSARDQEICDRIGPILRAEGLVFVGIDVIGPWLTEINVTSPTGIQEINRLNGVRLEETLLDAAERRTP